MVTSSLFGQRLDPTVRGAGYEPSGIFPGEPGDPFSLIHTHAQIEATVTASAVISKTHTS